MGLIPISNILMEEFVLLHPLIVMGWDGRKIVMAKHIFLTVVACRVLAVSGADRGLGGGGGAGHRCGL